MLLIQVCEWGQMLVACDHKNNRRKRSDAVFLQVLLSTLLVVFDFLAHEHVNLELAFEI